MPFVGTASAAAKREESDMGDRADKRWLVIGVAILMAVLLAEELYRHLIVRPVALPTLLFELVEVILLVGCAVAGTLMIQRVRAQEMAVAMAAMLVALLVGELYLGERTATQWTLLLELVEVVLLVGCAVACATLASCRGRHGPKGMDACV